MHHRFILLLAALWMPVASGLACTLGSGVPEQDLPEALRSSELAFVAQLSGYSQQRPDAGGKYFLGRIGYVLLEAIKGQPESVGALIERTPYPAVDGVPPGPACGPWVATPNNQGATFLVFASRSDATGHLRPHPFSLRLDIKGVDSEKWLDFIRNQQRNQQKP